MDRLKEIDGNIQNGIFDELMLKEKIELLHDQWCDKEDEKQNEDCTKKISETYDLLAECYPSEIYTNQSLLWKWALLSYIDEEELFEKECNAHLEKWKTELEKSFTNVSAAGLATAYSEYADYLSGYLLYPEDDESKEYYFKALELWRKLSDDTGKPEDYCSYADSCLRYANCFYRFHSQKDRMKAQTAVDYYNKALEALGKKSLEEYKGEKRYHYLKASVCYHLSKRYSEEPVLRIPNTTKEKVIELAKTAVDQYSQLHKDDPTDTDWMRYLSDAYLLLARVYDSFADTNLAIESYEKALETLTICCESNEERSLWFQSRLAIDYIVIASEKALDYNKAIAITQKYDSSDATAKLIIRYIDSGKIKEQDLQKYEKIAIDCLEKALKTEFIRKEEQSIGWYLLGDLYIHSSEQRKAEEAYSKGERLATGNNKL